MVQKNSYTADDISSLTMDIDRVQKFPHLYIPNNKLAGLIHLIREIKDNSDDEVFATIASGIKTDPTIDVYFNEDTKEIEIVDTGRGVPHEKLRELCEVLHSSGKFEKGKNNAYNKAGGLHGVGLKLANFLSDYFICKSTRDGIEYTVEYELGQFKVDYKIEADKKKHGTRVIFKPSSKFMKELDKLKCDVVINMIEAKAECCPGLTTNFIGVTKNGKEIKKTFAGLDIFDILYKYNNTTSKLWGFDFKSDDTEIRLVFGYDARMVEGCNILGYCNYIKNTEGGTHVEGFVNTLTDFMRKYMDTKYLSEKEKKELQIKKEDVRLGLCGVIIVLMTKPSFKGQYKEELTSDELKDVINKWLRDELKKLPDKDLQEMSLIIKSNAKARLSSLRARTQVKKMGNKLSGEQVDNYIGAPIDYDGQYNEIYFCEGLSAGNQLRDARYEFQHIFKMRGKIDNIMDTPVNALNKIDIINKMGIALEMIPGKPTSKLKFNAYKILTDADPFKPRILGLRGILYRNVYLKYGELIHMRCARTQSANGECSNRIIPC